jgi:hypothetical protein
MFNLLPRLYSCNIKADGRLLEIIKEAKAKVSKYFGIPEYNLNLNYSIENLPEIYKIGVKRVGSYFIPYVRRVGKVMGMFLPHLNHVFIDPINLLYRNLLRKTIFHEVIHKAQELLGKLYNRPRYKIEEEAEYLTEKLLNS